MKKYVLILTAIMLLTLTSAVYSVDSDIDGLNVTTDIDEAFDLSQSENKTLMIVFDQDSCVYCDMFRDDVLSNADIQKELNENYVVLLVDINRNPDIAAKYKVFGTPSLQFIAPDGKELDMIEGYVDASEFSKILKEI